MIDIQQRARLNVGEVRIVCSDYLVQACRRLERRLQSNPCTFYDFKPNFYYQSLRNLRYKMRRTKKRRRGRISSMAGGREVKKASYCKNAQRLLMTWIMKARLREHWCRILRRRGTMISPRMWWKLMSCRNAADSIHSSRFSRQSIPNAMRYLLMASG